MPGVAQRLAHLLNGDFYVVFTSIHEAMIHSVDSLYPPEDLERILKETIMEATPEEDFLTDKIYKYSRKTGTFGFIKMVLSLILECQNFLNKKGKCDDKSNWIISSLDWNHLVRYFYGRDRARCERKN